MIIEKSSLQGTLLSSAKRHCVLFIISSAITSHNGRPCHQTTGQRIFLRESQRGFKLNRWYVQCFRLAKSGCRVCSLELFCHSVYAAECAQAWLQKSLLRTDNDSISIWIQVGLFNSYGKRLRKSLWNSAERNSFV